MTLVRLSIRNLMHHWPLSLAALFTLVLGIASLASIPIYQEIIAYRDIHQTMLRHSFPGSRNIYVVAAEGSRLDEKLYDLITRELSDLILERIVVGKIKLSDLPPEPKSGSAQAGQKFQFYHLWSFTDLEKRIKLVEGRFPRYQAVCQLSDTQILPILEVAVGVDAAKKKGVKVGDLYSADGARGQFLLAVVGIIEPTDPQHDAWWEDRTTFGYQLKLIGRSTELVTLSMHVHKETLEDCFPDSTFSWRILLSGDRITPQMAEWLHGTLNNLQAQLSKDHAELQSGLPSILLDFQYRLAAARVIVLLIASQVFIFTGFTFWILVTVQVERYRKELTRLIDRGASKVQIILTFFIQDSFLASLATLLAWLAVSLYRTGLVNGMSSSEVIAGLSPIKIPAQSSAFICLAGGVCWLLITTLSFWASLMISPRELNWRPRLFEHASRERPIWQRFYLDVVLLVLSGVLYWQLTQGGSLIARRIEGVRLIDPFLLLSSTLLLLSVILLTLRLIPYPLRVLSWLAGVGRGRYVFLSLAHLSHDLRMPGQIILMVSLAVSFTMMTNVFRSSLADGQQETAYSISGADLRISSDARTPESILEDVSSLRGIVAASPMFRSHYSSMNNQSVELLAIDPKSITQVNGTLQSVLLERLSQETSKNSLPAIFSPSLVSSPEAIGEEREVVVSGQELLIEIVGVAHDFPTASGKFILIDVYKLAEQLNLATSHFYGEAWLAVDDRYLDRLIQDNRLGDRILSDVQTEIRILQSNALSQGIVGAFRLNALALSLLSTVAFLMLHCFSIEKQSHEFNLTRAIGFDPAPSSRITAIQGLLTVILGMAIGIGVGYITTQLLLPYLWMTLVKSLNGVEVHTTVIDWIDLLRYCAIMIGCFTIIMLILYKVKWITARERFHLPAEE